jgi:hypothetical protein
MPQIEELPILHVDKELPTGGRSPGTLVMSSGINYYPRTRAIPGSTPTASMPLRYAQAESRLTTSPSSRTVGRHDERGPRQAMAAMRPPSPTVLKMVEKYMVDF